MSSSDTSSDTEQPALYRLEKTLIGERLVAVARVDDATHVAMTSVRHIVDESTRHNQALQEERQRLALHIQDLETQLGRALRRVEQAELMITEQQREAVRHGASLRKLLAKNAALIGEKRRIRDLLVAKHAPPPIHYRVDIDRDDQARESIVITLDAFPDRAHARDALAEARRAAERRDGQLKTLRLDTVAWRAVVQQPMSE